MNTSEQKKQEAEAAFDRGKAYHEKKEYDLAIKEYSEAIKLDVRYSDLCNKLNDFVNCALWKPEEFTKTFYSYKNKDFYLNDFCFLRMQQLENAESKFPGKYDYWYENIIEAMEELIKKNAMNEELNKHSWLKEKINFCEKGCLED